VIGDVFCAAPDQANGLHRDVREEGVAGELGQALDAVLEGRGVDDGDQLVVQELGHDLSRRLKDGTLSVYA